MIKLLSIVLSTLITLIPVKVNIFGSTAKPIIVKVNRFNESSAAKFAADMRAAQSTGQSVIPIVIDSYGGSVYSLMSMLDVIDACKVPVATIVMGKAMSAGSVLLSAGTKGLRFASPRSTILIHQVSSMVRGTAQDIKISSQEVQRLNDKLLNILSKNSKKPKGFFKKVLLNIGNGDLYLTPKQAKQYGLIDHVGIPTLETIILIKTTLKKAGTNG